MSSNQALIGVPVMWPNFLSFAFHCARLTGQRYLNPRQLATPDVLIQNIVPTVPFLVFVSVPCNVVTLAGRLP